jgi:uncharacterized protein YdeI (YjbR/CyaY-like superfamily)
MQSNEIEIFYPANQKDWRQWLKQNHSSKQSVWLVFYKMKSGIPTISWSDAVDEALCFGWIDSVRKSINDEKFIQFFSKRKANSTWSKVNKEKIQKLISEKKMMKAGVQSIELAKQNGSWTILDDVEELIIPEDLEKAFMANPGSKTFFLSLSKSVKKMILAWVVLAKQPETRKKRIVEIAERAGLKLKPKQF